MRSIGIGLPLLALLSFTSIQAFTASAAGSAAFCATWLKVCNQTCPGGAGTCRDVCAIRQKTCLATGCFPFNVPGPRCQTNARDEAATIKARKAARDGRGVGCGPRFGNRPCD